MDSTGSHIVDIFISYAREDEASIQHLARTLEEHGWYVFWDRRIPAGKTWHSYITKALGAAKCVIVAWSRYSIASDWVIEEANVGKQRNVLVPILLNPVEPPIGFRSIQAADLGDWQPGRPSQSFEQLIQDIRRVLGITPTKPETAQPVEPEAETLSENIAINDGRKVKGKIIYKGKFFLGNTYFDILLDNQIIGSGEISRGFCVPFVTKKGAHSIQVVATNKLVRTQFDWIYRLLGHKTSIDIYLPEIGEYEIYLDVSRANKVWTLQGWQRIF